MSIPLASRLPRTYRIKEMRRETEMVRTMIVDCTLGAKPGQFVMIWVPGVNEVPMSVASDGDTGLRITFFAVGETTKILAAMKSGDLVGVRGPFGSHYEWKPKQHLALVAGGYGASPMYFAAHEATKNGCTIEAIVGARSKEHLLFLSEFEALPRTTLHIATNDGSMGHKGFNVELLEQLLSSKEGKSIDQIFACGPEMMLVSVSKVSAAKKVPSQLSLERYMKCGYGLCGNCTVDPLGIRMCIEGPVVKNELCMEIAEFGKYHRDGLGRKVEFQ